MRFRAYNENGPDVMLEGEDLSQAVLAALPALYSLAGIPETPDSARLYYDPNAFGGPGGAALCFTLGGRRYEVEIYATPADLPYPITLF